MTKKLGAEFLGTAWLVFGGCGSAVLAAAFPGLGIGFVGVALAFGLTVLTMAYAVGHISGGHFNPAVTVGLWAGGRFKASEILPYWVAQVLGALAGAFVLSLIATGKAGFDLVQGGFAANGYAEHSPGGYSLVAGFVAEVVLTFFFLIVILGSTDRRAPAGFAPHRDRPRAHPHPPRRHPGHQHVGEPGAQHGPGPLRGRLGARAAVALLGRPDRRRRRRGHRQPLAVRGRRHVATRPFGTCRPRPWLPRTRAAAVRSPLTHGGGERTMRMRGARTPPTTASEAVRRLVAGNHAFARMADAAKRGEAVVMQLDPGELGFGTRPGVAPKQRPFAAVLGCSDARVPIEMVFQQRSNDVFVVRVAGNGIGLGGLGSFRYAVSSFGSSLRLVVVLGHSQCGAVTAAVDAFLHPRHYLPLASNFPLRSIVDGLLVSVRAASIALERTHGPAVADRPGYAPALVETAVIVNAAWAAYALERELAARRCRVVFGRYDIGSGRLGLPLDAAASARGTELVAAPRDAGGFSRLGESVAASPHVKALLERSGAARKR